MTVFPTHTHTLLGTGISKADHILKRSVTEKLISALFHELAR